MTCIKNPWGDGRDAAVSNEQCQARSCLHVGEDKGTFVPGRGYTSYHKNPTLMCMTRMLHGCPFPLPEPDLEKIRCCVDPDFPQPRKNRQPWRQKCRTCNQHASGWVLIQRKLLPPQPHTDCRHLRLIRTDNLCWYCPDCKLYWPDAKPTPKQLGFTYADLLDGFLAGKREMP